MTRLLLFCFAFTISIAHAQQFKLSYPASAFNQPFTGKVFLYLSKNNREPKTGEVGIEYFPAFSVDVKNVSPGSTVVIDDKAASYPVPLSDVERGTYYAQAVWDRNLGGRSIAESPGNMYSTATKVTFTKDYKKIFAIVCDKVVPEQSFAETQFVKELKVPSKLLSDFSKKPTTVNAAVLLPATYYTQPTKKFPVLFYVFGYGGDYHRLSGDTEGSALIDTISCIEVVLDGNCTLGHSVYANSDNNGPWGDALVKELIPELENKFRCNGARLLTGHSSGGWTVLWLQTQYPSTFAGCWSSSPDPVDFRNFQKINLYNGENMFYDKDSALRNVATVAGFIPWASQKQAYQAETVIYRGEQMHSFDAVFSGKGADGNPERICDPLTGAVNTKVFEHWKRYDISSNVRTNWGTLKKDLQGKIRVSVGEGDNFLLNHAVHLFDDEMKKLNAGFVFAYVPGDHFTIHTKEYWNNGMQFLALRYEEWLKTR
jgi:S-formylglutathione hydrolase FrmB